MKINFLIYAVLWQEWDAIRLSTDDDNRGLGWENTGSDIFFCCEPKSVKAMTAIRMSPPKQRAVEFVERRGVEV